jgi:hypothetical protein
MADELASAVPPFLLVAEVVDDPERGDTRPAVHHGNQFRLLRKDMVGEIREEIQTQEGISQKRYCRPFGTTRYRLRFNLQATGVGNAIPVQVQYCSLVQRPS